MEIEPRESPASLSLRNQSGKACTNCARVKCKCIPRADDTRCERCHRLDKTCVPSASAKPRGPKRGAASRSARLEEKLDGLVALLQARQVPATPSHGERTNSSFEVGDGADSPSTSQSFISTPSIDDDYPDEPSLFEADESLSRFRQEMTTFTPYVYIPPDMTSMQVRQRYPFLWVNIMSVASKSVKTRNSLSLQTRRIIIEKVVAGGERSLDLLFGILTFVNWVHLFPMDKQFASLASQLAVSLVWDLGLHMPPPDHPSRFPPDVNAAKRPQQPIRKERTIEEQRAVLGAFVVTSVLAQTLKSADGFRWSPYLDQYLSDISQKSTIPQDKILVKQVKMQLIVNQVRYSSWRIKNMEIPTAWVDVLQLQLDEIISGVNQTSSAFGSDSTLLGFCYYTTLVIREWIMAKSPIPRHEPDLKRYEVYQRCVSSIKAWLDIFFSMPLKMYASVPCSTYCQLCYVVLFLHQVTTDRDPAWHLTAAQDVADPLHTVDKIIDTFERMKAAAVTRALGGGEDQALSLGIKKFQLLKSAWHSEMAPQAQGQSTVQEAEMPDDYEAPFLADSLDSFSFQMLPSMANGIPWQ